MGLLGPPQPGDYKSIVYRSPFSTSTWIDYRLHELLSGPLRPGKKPVEHIDTRHIFQGGLFFCFQRGFWDVFSAENLALIGPQIPWRTTYNAEVWSLHDLTKCYSELMRLLACLKLLGCEGKPGDQVFWFTGAAIDLLDKISMED